MTGSLQQSKKHKKKKKQTENKADDTCNTDFSKGPYQQPAAQDGRFYKSLLHGRQSDGSMTNDEGVGVPWDESDDP